MMKIMARLWDKHEPLLKEKIDNLTQEEIQDLEYKDLVYFVFHYIYTGEYDYEIKKEDIIEIDRNSYQGVKFYAIATEYDPGAEDYLTTYAYYGSCTYCDALQALQSEYKTTREQQSKDILELCRDIAENTKCPYNTGWRHNPEFDEMEWED